MAHHLARPLLPIHFCGRTPTVANWTPTGQLKLLSLQRHAWVHCHVLPQTGIELATGYSGPGGSAQLQLLKPFPHLSVASSGLSCSAQELSLQPAGSAAPWQVRDLSAVTGDQTHGPYTRRQIFNHWTTREAPRGC